MTCINGSMHMGTRHASPRIRPQSINYLQLIVVVSTLLLVIGLSLHFYIATDPNPDWWERNYPWLRFATILLLLGGIAVIGAGVVLILLRSEPTYKSAEGITSDSVNNALIETIRSRNPRDIRELISIIKDKLRIPESRIVDSIATLQAEEKIDLEPQAERLTPYLSDYLRSARATWFWRTLVLTVASTFAVLVIHEDMYPLVYVRYVLGSILVLWFPGYTCVKALFPAGLSRTIPQDLDSMERVVLSLGISIALVPALGLILNYTPWGVRLIPLTLLLFPLNILLATFAVIREHGTLSLVTKS